MERKRLKSIVAVILISTAFVATYFVIRVALLVRDLSIPEDDVFIVNILLAIGGIATAVLFVLALYSILDARKDDKGTKRKESREWPSP